MAMMFAHQQVAIGKLRSTFYGLQASNTELGKMLEYGVSRSELEGEKKKGRTENGKAENKRGNKETN